MYLILFLPFPDTRSHQPFFYPCLPLSKKPHELDGFVFFHILGIFLFFIITLISFHAFFHVSDSTLYINLIY